MITVNNEYELPGPGHLGSRDYVRSMSDPTILIDGWEGACYLRADGEPWNHHGYRVHVRDGSTVPEVEVATNHLGQWKKARGPK